jgi:thiol:disulfide interchange protein
MHRFTQPTRLFAIWLLALAPVYVPAQESADPLKLNIADQLGLPAFGGSSGGEKVTFTGKYQIAKGSREGRLSIEAVIEPNWHVYSVTQLPGGPIKSVIKVADSKDFQVAGPFEADTPPDIKEYEFWTVPIEEHSDKVTWTAPIRLAEGADPEKLKFDVKFTGQVCEEVCVDIRNKVIEVEFAGYYEPPQVITEFSNDKAHVTLRGQIEPPSVQPGETATLTITAEPEPTWHIYAYAEKDPELVSKPTIIALTQSNGWSVGSVQASSEPIEHETGLDDEPISYFHEEPVSWSMEVQVPADTESGEYNIAGLIGYQTCTLTGCDRQTAAQFSATLVVGIESTADGSLGFTEARYGEAAKLLKDDTGAPTNSVAGTASSSPAAPKLDFSTIKTFDSDGSARAPVWMLLMAFGAGFILNFMPCVLPVIGLKVMSFVQQAGQSRRQVFMLNLWYSLGLMSVFMVLATLCVVFGMQWAEHFNSPTFNTVLAAVVFAFALSLLGVWEIPLPGFTSSGKMQDLAAQEGAGGAFFKGVLTTVLATPCSGPLLVPAAAWALAQPAPVTYSAFACVGLGMAFPFVLIGAFPKLVAFLPKPGEWMDTFKHLMGFVLLGTVVLLLTFVPMPNVIPIVAFLMGLWAMLWWAARVPLYESLNKRIRAWAGGAAFATLIGIISFGWLLDAMEGRFRENVAYAISEQAPGSSTPTVASEGDELPWQPYSLGLLERVIEEGKTVFVDFTAPS